MKSYLAMGDSTGVGVGARHGGFPQRVASRLQAAGHPVHLVNVSESGATTDDLVADQLPALKRVSPDLVTVGIGINDVTRAADLHQVAAGFERILNAIRAAGHPPVVVTNLPAVELAPVVPPAYRNVLAMRVEAVNALIAAVTARFGARLVDVHSTSRTEIPKHPEFFSPDGFHPSDMGYEHWASVLWPTVAELAGAWRAPVGISSPAG